MNQIKDLQIPGNNPRSIYILGGYTTLIVILFTLLDIVAGSILGGNLSAIPATSIGRFSQFQDNWLIGLYNLDLLNIINQIIFIPSFFALYVALGHENKFPATLALIFFLVGTTVFITTNSALPMWELSKKYATETFAMQKNLYAAAGEAMIARGAHGSPGSFIGFVLPNIAGIIISFLMLSGKLFNKTTAILGIAGSILIVTYLFLVTFVPAVKQMAMIFAMPGGLMLLAWMIMFTIRLFQLGITKKQ
jgi:hypothetical protein